MSDFITEIGQNTLKDIDQLRQNYEEMDETGQEKLEEVPEKILNIWKITHEE